MANDNQGAPEPKALGELVQRLRAERGLSLRELAAAADVDYTWVSKLERGLFTTPGPRYLARLARALEVEPAELYLSAGYRDGQGLPAFAPYLRAKYELPEEAIRQLEAHFDLIDAKYRDDLKQKETE